MVANYLTNYLAKTVMPHLVIYEFNNEILACMPFENLIILELII